MIASIISPLDAPEGSSSSRSHADVDAVSWGQHRRFAAWPEAVRRRFLEDRVIHRRLLHAHDSDVEAWPMLYVRADSDRYATHDSTNSPRSVADGGQYENLRTQLESLKTEDTDKHEAVEGGAVDTAMTILNALQRHNYAPPLITPQGDDAVVMLWSLGGTTYAITITDGELGYVARRDRKNIKLVDSIRVDKFQLLGLDKSIADASGTD